MPREACHCTAGWVAGEAAVVTMGLSGMIQAPGWEVGLLGVGLTPIVAALGDLPDRAEEWGRRWLGLTIEHRGPTHTLDGAALVAGLLALLMHLWRPELGWVTFWACWTAMASHSILDRLNTTPVQLSLLLPWLKFKFLPGRWFPEASERERSLENTLPVLIAVGWIVVAWPVARAVVFGWVVAALPASLHGLVAPLVAR